MHLLPVYCGNKREFCPLGDFDALEKTVPCHRFRQTDKPEKRLSFLESFMDEKNIRVLIAKPGLDGHDRGAKVICRSLRDAGFEVIYTGLRRTPEEIVNAAIQEDVDVLGLSILSGAHNVIFPKIMDLLKESGAGDVAVIAGGIIPDTDISALEKIGISKIFLPGSPTQKIVGWIENHVRKDSSEKKNKQIS